MSKDRRARTRKSAQKSTKPGPVPKVAKPPAPAIPRERVIQNLLAAFDGFSAELRAASIELPDKSRRVDGRVNAQELSKATYAIFSAMAAADAWLTTTHGRPVTKLPPGVVLLESDAPDDKYKPVPLSEIEISIRPEGADGRIESIIETLRPVVSFALERFNEAQRVTTGIPPRWRDGDVISATDCARVASLRERYIQQLMLNINSIIGKNDANSDMAELLASRVDYSRRRPKSFCDEAREVAINADLLVRCFDANSPQRIVNIRDLINDVSCVHYARRQLAAPDSPRVQRVIDTINEVLHILPSICKGGDATWGRQLQTLFDAIEGARSIGPAQSAPPAAKGGKAVFTPTAQDLDILGTLSRRVGRVHGSKLSVLGVGQKVLSERLKRLEDEGMVDRAEGEKRGYAITPNGRALVENNAPNKRQQSAP